MMRRSRAAAALESRTMAATSAAIKVGKFERERERADWHQLRGLLCSKKGEDANDVGDDGEEEPAAKVKGMKSARIFFLRRRRRRRVAIVCCHRACDRDRPRPPARLA